MFYNVSIPRPHCHVQLPHSCIPSPTPQVLFKRRLSGRQWFSLLLLTLGCVIKQLNFGDLAAAQSGRAWHEGLFSVNLLLNSLVSMAAFRYRHGPAAAEAGDKKKKE